MAVPSFVDKVTLKVTGGRGGNGAASVHREKFKPLGGPDGGNGGNGGSVILRVDPGLSTLVDYYHRPHRRAENGRHGQGDHRNGAQGDPVVLEVPEGTVVTTPEGRVLTDLTGADTEYVAAAGGKGGLGNAALASKTRKAPGFALLGEPGEERTLVLELKMVADVGLVGYPSAGKSSLIAAVSRARPKIADYPFTTLVPNLGVVTAGETTFTVADVPGLIAGASQGRGLGLDFLRHLERCAALLHVVDCATTESGRDPVSDVEAMEAELAAHGGLEDRPRLVALNKVDVPDGSALAEMARPELQRLGFTVFEVSAASHEGLAELTFALAAIVRDTRTSTVPAEPARTVLRPVVGERADDSFTVERVGEAWRVRGRKPERWVRQTDFANDEAVGYLADRFYRLGIEETLTERGAEPGDDVIIGADENAVVFSFEPQVPAGGETLLGRRGHDPRLEGRRVNNTDDQH